MKNKDRVRDDQFDVDAPSGKWIEYIHEGCCEGKDPALHIMRTSWGWVYKCHRCGISGWKKENLSPDQMVKKVTSVPFVEEDRDGEIRLPKDFTTKIPVEGLLWLEKYGITDKEIEWFRFGYSKLYNRLIMPVFKSGELVYWQGRNLGEVTRYNPKYINASTNRKNIYFRVRKGRWDKVCIVEDILSAIIVGRECNTYALLHASIPDSLISDLYTIYETIYLWLDPDKRGEMAASVLRYRSIGINVFMILSDKDPKCYSKIEIRRYLQND